MEQLAQQTGRGGQLGRYIPRVGHKVHCVSHELSVWRVSNVSRVGIRLAYVFLPGIDVHYLPQRAGLSRVQRRGATSRILASPPSLALRARRRPRSCSPGTTGAGIHQAAGALPSTTAKALADGMYAPELRALLEICNMDGMRSERFMDCVKRHPAENPQTQSSVEGCTEGRNARCCHRALAVAGLFTWLRFHITVWRSIFATWTVLLFWLFS